MEDNLNELFVEEFLFAYKFELIDAHHHKYKEDPCALQLNNHYELFEFLNIEASDNERDDSPEKICKCYKRVLRLDKHNLRDQYERVKMNNYYEYSMYFD